MSEISSTYILETQGLLKSFKGSVAVSDVSLIVCKAIVGEFLAKIKIKSN
jgi:hypothetical protein